MVDLNKSQLEALRVLAAAKEPVSTSSGTAHGYVDGNSARALMRRGLARFSSWPKVEITAAGRIALTRIAAAQEKP
jgi:hypothetical protein